MAALDDIRMFARFIRGLPGFLHHPGTLEQAEAQVRQRMQRRAENFLRLVEKGIFAYPHSPYLPLLKLAQVELGDIRNLVRDKGLEGTLHTLHEAGVYVTYEEFKGRQPMVRHGQHIALAVQCFDNPFCRGHYYAHSGGSSGFSTTRVPIDLDRITQQSTYRLLNLHVHGLLGAPQAFWLGTLPDHTGTSALLQQARIRHAPGRWFTYSEAAPAILKHRATTGYIHLMGALLGLCLPLPELVRLNEAAVVARWVHQTLQRHPYCLVEGLISGLVRVCVAAQQEGLELTGAALMGGGEPATLAKVQQMWQVGARWIPGYWFAELGPIGFGCAQPLDTTDVHLFKDALAVIQYRRQVPLSTLEVDAFCFTTLLPSASKILLNVESDDYGIIEQRSCGCGWEAYGFTEHVRQVHSFHKLTGEGVSLVGSEMMRILQEVLPVRFGGTPLDYQLEEEEDEQGFTRLNLLVSPRVPHADEHEVIETVLEAMRQSSVAAGLAQSLWRQAGTLRVKRQEPVWTARGKLLPLHLARPHKEDQQQ